MPPIRIVRIVPSTKPRDFSQFVTKPLDTAERMPAIPAPMP